jgi:hypothetical protein
LEVSDFLDLVVVNDQTLSVKGLSLEVLLGLRASIWLLEADESISVLASTLLELYSLDLSELLECGFEFLLRPGGWEVLDVEVASFLGVLISDHFLEFFLSSLFLTKEFSDVQLDFLSFLFSH